MKLIKKEGLFKFYLSHVVRFKRAINSCKNILSMLNVDEHAIHPLFHVIHKKIRCIL